MSIIGHGIDLVAIDRIAELLDKHADRFAERCFTAAERDYCEANDKRRLEHYAARFAAKEAALKALGTGWVRGIAWTDVEVVRRPSGQPELRICGKAAEFAEEMGIRRWLISLTHAGEYAMASAIALGN